MVQLHQLVIASVQVVRSLTELEGLIRADPTALRRPWPCPRKGDQLMADTSISHQPLLT